MMPPRVAIVADWLPTIGGAERVIAHIHGMWPDALIHTTVARHERLHALPTDKVRTSRLQWIYTLIGRHEPLLPLMPRMMEEIDLRGYDIVISSSHAVGKGVIPPSTALHVCYCHTPMRYAWEMENEYFKDFGIPRFLQRRLRRLLAGLRRWDLGTAKRVDLFLANSSVTKERIKRIYGRDSIVVPPPVDDRFLDTPLRQEQREGYLAIGRLVPYKRFDLLIDAANRLKIPLSIAGTGKDVSRLRRMAGPTVRFLGHVPDADLPALYQSAKALIFPVLEDAGVVPLEAQASGTPVIAFGTGGVRDTVIDATTGLFFGEQTVDSLTGAIERFKTLHFDAAFIRNHARQFSARRFRERIESIVSDAYAGRLARS